MAYMCPVCKGTGFVAANDVFKGGPCPQCSGFGAIVQGLDQPYSSGCDIPGCAICSPRPKEKPKKMNWPIAIYSQNGELPIKFAIEREEPFRFSIRLINQFGEGWWVSVWFDGHEFRGVRAETLEEAESKAREILTYLFENFASIGRELGVPLDLGA